MSDPLEESIVGLTTGLQQAKMYGSQLERGLLGDEGIQQQMAFIKVR
jgi:hypothetical protein